MDKLVLKNNKGEEKEFDILLTFDSNDKTYVVYREKELIDNELIIYSGCYKKEDKDLKIEEVTTSKEIQIINDFINTLKNSSNIN